MTNNWLNNIEISKEWTLASKEVEIISEEITDEIPEEQEEIPENATEENQDSEILEESESTEIVDENNYIINYVYTIGANISESDVNDSYEVRPVVFLKARILLLDGNGSLETPYVVK